MNRQGAASLSMAIVQLAARDRRKSQELLDKNPDNYQALMIKRDVERFFQGEWFEFLCMFSDDIRQMAT